MPRSHSSGAARLMLLWRKLVPMMVPAQRGRPAQTQILAPQGPGGTEPSRTGGGRWTWQGSWLVDGVARNRDRWILHQLFPWTTCSQFVARQWSRKDTKRQDH